MKSTSVFLVSLLMLAFTGCKSTETPAPGSGIEGTWQLTSRQCYCSPGFTPNEQVMFGGRQMTFYENGRVARTGEFALTMATSACLGGNGSPAPALRFSFTAGGAGSSEPLYTLSGNTLTLDYGGPCDAPVDIYQRVQP